ncbi:hypothetical protein MJ575_00940 [Klebsiella pneumoniae]|nr:hypothetical protein MJ575_00940 [Klebsiella pneumoniae]
MKSSHLSGCWIFARALDAEGNQMARRDNADPSGLGNTWAGHGPGAQPPHPV